MKNSAMIFGLVLIVFAIAVDAQGQQVKYCKNFQTGEIYVVEANMPCPYPTVEL